MRLKTGEEILLDPEDEQRLGALDATWRINTFKRLQRVTRSTRNAQGQGSTQHLTTFLLGPAPPGQVWTHANRDRLDYRRANLRAVPRGEAISEEGRRRIAERSRPSTPHPQEAPSDAHRDPRSP